MAATSRSLVAIALTLLLAGATSASDAEKRGLYPALNVLGFFTDETKAALKVTPDQARRLKSGEDQRNKVWRRYADATVKVTNSRLPEREKNVQLRTLETQAAEELFRLYGETLRPDQVKRMRQIVLQVRGMEVFDHPEVRKTMKIGDAEVKKLRAAYNRLAQETVADLRAQVQAKKITDKDAARQAIAMSVSVPESVRASLSQEQKRVLQDLLGEKYTYK
jgi:hypothetical protein